MLTNLLRRFAPSLTLALLLWGGPAVVASEGEQAAPTPSQEAAAPSPVDEVLIEFSRYFNAHDYTKAGEVLKKGEALDPENPAILTARAGIYAETGEYEKARAIYTALAAKLEQPFIPRFNLAEIYFLQKDWAKGREAFEVLLKDYPDNDLVRLKIGLSYLAEKNLPKAQEVFSGLMRPQPTPFMLYAEAAMSISMGQIARGKEMITFAEQRFGPGRSGLLYDSLAGVGLVIRGDYPPDAAPVQP